MAASYLFFFFFEDPFLNFELPRSHTSLFNELPCIHYWVLPIVCFRTCFRSCSFRRRVLYLRTPCVEHSPRASSISKDFNSALWTMQRNVSWVFFSISICIVDETEKLFRNRIWKKLPNDRISKNHRKTNIFIFLPIVIHEFGNTCESVFSLQFWLIRWLNCDGKIVFLPYKMEFLLNIFSNQRFQCWEMILCKLLRA